MNAIHIRKKLDAAPADWPELNPFVGKTVEIFVIEDDDLPQVTPGTGDFESLTKLIEEIRKGYDFDAVQSQREYDRLHALDHVL